MGVLDAPHWSYMNGCGKHRGHIAPCKLCLAEKDPGVTLDGQPAFLKPSSPASVDKKALWEDFFAL